MKRNIKLFMGVALASLSLATTSCIDETEPTSGATQNQIDQSKNTVSGMLMALPKRLNVMEGDTYQHYAFGYGAMMHVRDIETGDMPIAFSDYDQFMGWERNLGQGDAYMMPQYLWNYYYQSVLTCNKLLASATDVTGSDSLLVKGARGAAYAFRAMYYLDMARCYEYLPADVTEAEAKANGVEGLTVPIVTDTTTQQDTKNNPRATHKQMFAFIKNDLDSALTYVPYLAKASESLGANRTLPHEAAVYGLYARLYMWDGANPDGSDKAAADGSDPAAVAAGKTSYRMAYDYANTAIKAASSDAPMLYSDCLEVNSTSGEITGYTKTCFNTLSKFLWGAQQTDQDATVTSGIVNWTSWMSPQCSFGYAGAGPVPMMDNNLFKEMYAGNWMQVFFDSDNKLTPNVGYKFQPNEGNYTNYKVACASAYPLMRIEEMYFIQAEALAHYGSAKNAKTLFEGFMNNYRSDFSKDKYKISGSDKEDVIKAIVNQKRIEFWGEGISFFDIKRLNWSVTRGYSGTNFKATTRFNTKGRPAWMNWCIVRTEQNNNAAIVGKNNPDPSSKYTEWTEE